MGLIKRIKKGLESILSGGKKIVGISLLTGFLAFSSCSKGHNSTLIFPYTGTGTGTSTSTSTGISHRPVITTSDLGTAIEGQNINKIIQGTDEDLDYPLNFNLKEGPTGASILPMDNTRAVLSYIASHEQSDNSYNVTIEVQDSTGQMSNKSYVLPVKNVSYVTYTILEAGSGLPISGINVFLGSDNQTTDGSGTATFIKKQTGAYPVTIEDSLLGQYVTFKPGNLEVSKEKEDLNKLDLEARLIPEQDFQFVEDCARGPPGFAYRRIKKWRKIPHIKIYTRAYPDNSSVTPEVLDLVNDILRNQISGRFYDANGNQIILDNNNIEEIPTMPVFGQDDNNAYIYFNKNVGGGSNFSWIEGDEIISAEARGPPTLNQRPTWTQELTELFIGSGETQDSFYNDSVLYDGTSQPYYSLHDDTWIDIHKTRPIGNRSLYTSPDNRDVNPNGTIVNP